VCDYVVDTLPRIDRSPANVSDPAYLELPQTSAAPPVGSGSTRHVLISFGGEDPAHLTEQTAALLAPNGAGQRVSVVRPSMRELGAIPAGIRVIEPQPDLVSLLKSADWVITSFGMTAYEAAALGRRVITVAPTTYHDRLAAVAGFYRAGVERPAPWRIQWALGQTADHGPATTSWPGPDPASLGTRKSLSVLIQELPGPRRRGCPVHEGAHGGAVWRNEEKSYFRCPRCGLVYMERFARDEERYDESYFMEEYRAQYGRTYLDDFRHIYGMGRRRLVDVRRARGTRATGTPALLDVGCAYGPFLAAARDEGYAPFGIDIAPEAVAYVRDELGIPAVAGNVLDLDIEASLGRSQFDVVALWYVVEHFDRLDELLSRLAQLVRTGGVLALSTPHGGGVSARRAPDRFFRASPRDHYTIWNRESAAFVLGEYGFGVDRVVVTGHHPERYPAVQRGTLPKSAAAIHSRLFGRGDTFEIYAVRE
jgi:2-polyprenyl-3-methyl-5-hydroxy-6-metoxy-1,4-benzoquinol methylase